MVHEGISPEDAERLLIKPVEKELRALECVKEMSSTAYLGGATVVMEFDAGFDADKELAVVHEKVDLAKPELPEDRSEERRVGTACDRTCGCTGWPDRLQKKVSDI